MPSSSNVLILNILGWGWTRKESHADSSADLGQMDLSTLVRQCAVESERFYGGHSYDSRYAYELFRRAFVDRSEMAWQYIYIHYSPLVESWVRRSGAFTNSGESAEFFVGAAFTRFWRAVTPERFESFSTLAALLHYLQLCASCVVIDSVRAQSWTEVLPEEVLGVDKLHGLADPMLESAASAGFERWLDQAEQREQSPDASVDDAHLMRYGCGRWIALRRAQLGVTNAMVVEETGLNAQTLLLLESGLADEAGIPAEALAKLGDMLAREGDDAAWIADVVAIAGCKQSTTHNTDVYERLMIELQPTFVEALEIDDAWSHIDHLMNSEAERVVIFNSFRLGMTPGDIYAQRPDLFSSVNEVYNVKRNVLGRLSRNGELRRLLVS